jgi:hypothetical protein
MRILGGEIECKVHTTAAGYSDEQTHQRRLKRLYASAPGGNASMRAAACESLTRIMRARMASSGSSPVAAAPSFPRRRDCAHERDKRAKETRLRGWACRTRTQKCRRKLSL